MIVLCSVYDVNSYRGPAYSTCVQSAVGKKGCEGICENLDFLAPTDYIVFGHKCWSGDKKFSKWQPVSTDWYCYVYALLIEERWHIIEPWLQAMLDPKKDMTLCCYCPKGKFCHRQLIAHLIRSYRPDIQVVLR